MVIGGVLLRYFVVIAWFKNSWKEGNPKYIKEYFFSGIRWPGFMWVREIDKVHYPVKQT